jgi:hypothetical protein
MAHLVLNCEIRGLVNPVGGIVDRHAHFPSFPPPTTVAPPRIESFNQKLHPIIVKVGGLQTKVKATIVKP